MGVDIHPPETEYDPYYILYILYILYLVYLSTVGCHDGLATHRTWAHRQYDAWLGADRLRSKAIVPKSKEGSKAAFGAVMPQAAKKLLLVKPKARNWASNVTPSDSKWLQSFKNEFTWHMLTCFFRLFLLRFVFHQVKAPLDPGFSPLILAKQKYMEAAKDCKARAVKGVVELTSLVESMDLIIAFNTRLAALTTCACLEPQDKLTWALPRADGCGSYTLPVFADGTREARASAYLAGQSRSSDWLVQTHCKSWWILWIEKSWKVSRSIAMESSITMDRVSWACLLRASACRQAFWSRRWFGSAAPEVLSSMAHQRCASSSRSAFLQAQDHRKSKGIWFRTHQDAVGFCMCWIISIHFNWWISIHFIHSMQRTAL